MDHDLIGRPQVGRDLPPAGLVGLPEHVSATGKQGLGRQRLLAHVRSPTGLDRCDGEEASCPGLARLSNDADGGSKLAASAATISLLIVTSVKDWNTAALEVIVMQGL